MGGSGNNSPTSRLLKLEIVEICRQVEYSGQYLLPTLRSLFPDSTQRWGNTEICALLAQDDYSGYDEDNDAWKKSCPTFWMMLNDSYALTPGILDVLEETIDEMLKRGINVTPEDPPGAPLADEFSDFVSYMAERQRSGNL